MKMMEDGIGGTYLFILNKTWFDSPFGILVMHTVLTWQLLKAQWIFVIYRNLFKEKGKTACLLSDDFVDAVSYIIPGNICHLDRMNLKKSIKNDFMSNINHWNLNVAPVEAVLIFPGQFKNRHYLDLYDVFLFFSLCGCFGKYKFFLKMRM